MFLLIIVSFLRKKIGVIFFLKFLLQCNSRLTFPQIPNSSLKYRWRYGMGHWGGSEQRKLSIRMNFWSIHANRLALMNLIMTYYRLHSDLKMHGSSICLEVKEKADPLLWSVSTAEAHCSADASFWRSLNFI